MIESSPPKYLVAADGARIAYHQTAGRGPGVVFLTGFRSDMTGQKALRLEEFCRAHGQAFLRFDYSGHGASSGAFTEGTIGRWAADAIRVVESVTMGPQVLVGSSLGGWIMLLAARALGGRVAGLLGIAAAPDFTEDLIPPILSPSEREILARDGIIRLFSPYDPEPTPVTRLLLEEGRQHLLLRDEIPLTVPVRLIHGMNDADVPWRTSLRLAERLRSTDIEITLVKDGDHRLSRPEDLERLCDVLERLLRGLRSVD